MRIFLFAILLPAFVSGCAHYVNPLIGTVRTPRGDDGGRAMPLLAAAIVDVDERIVEMEGKRDANVSTARVLDLMMFGFGASSVYAALSKHAQAATNAAFGAGASYAGSTLFAPLDVTNIYNSGVTALACVANRGAALRTSVARYQAQVANDDAKQLPTAFATGGCTPDAKDLGEALSIQDKVKRLLGYAVGADAEEASRVRQAANGVVMAVNREVLKRSNNPDTILAAAKGLLSHGTGTVIQQKDVQPGARTPAMACSADVNQRIREFAIAYGEIDKVVTSALNSMAALDTSCVVDAGTTEALTLSQEEVTVTKDASFNVIVSGGRLPYVLTQIGAASKDITVQLVAPRTIVVTGLSTVNASTVPVTFQVKDNSVITAPKTLRVSGK